MDNQQQDATPVQKEQFSAVLTAAFQMDNMLSKMGACLDSLLPSINWICIQKSDEHTSACVTVTDPSGNEWRVHGEAEPPDIVGSVMSILLRLLAESHFPTGSGVPEEYRNNTNLLTALENRGMTCLDLLRITSDDQSVAMVRP